MDNFRICIDILFRKISPELMIKNNYDKISNALTNSNHIDQDLFTNIALNEFRQYSEDEISGLYKKLNEWMADRRQLLNCNKTSIFNMLISFGDDVFVEDDEFPQCRYEQTLRWRETSHKLGQDIFTTSYFAYKDMLTQKERKFFAWNPVISTNNRRLQLLLKNGLSENHFHLKGSAPIWSLSWVSLMNKINNRLGEFNATGINTKRLNPDLSFSSNEGKCNYYILFKKAAVIRAFLFCKLEGINFWTGDDNFNEMQLKKSLLDDDYLEYNTLEIQKNIATLRCLFTQNFNRKYKNRSASVDYALPKNVIHKNVIDENSYDIIDNTNGNEYLIGERVFLYSMFRKIYSNDIKFIKYETLLYAYLVIKSKIRNELIQCNDKVGFKNFADYQNRKTEFIKKNEVLNDALFKTAISSTIENQKIHSLEARIAPSDNASEMVKEIKNIDKINLKNQEKFFYVMHFIKERDTAKVNNTIGFTTEARHYLKRKEVKNQSIAIKQVRNSSSNIASRILGIDACNNEIGCRPEVFAQAYRYLRDEESYKKYQDIIEYKKAPKLRASYHAGEDFLDLVDGLRAIDEAIKFLNLTHGDRIGHALALGINVREWYKFKKNRLLLPKQDYLDNIVWMLAKIKEFNLQDKNNLIYELEEQYYSIFGEIYQESFKELGENDDFISHRNYYDAWKLRGNNPYIYLNCNFKERFEFTNWERASINYSFPKEKFIRENEKVHFLYRSYHFNPLVRKKGEEMYEFCVSKEFVAAACEIQFHMQRYVRDCGIGIETNPSSNYLIGTFKRYDKHPLVNMYNLGLIADYEKIEECPQLFVSINTDDQGIFDTCLENEYALMAISLEKAKDDNGIRLYNQAMIYDWLERIRKMGLEQSFMR